MNTDEKYISMAVELARRASGMTYPNPMVGAVIVCRDHVIGRGYHHKSGLPHAEVNAIASVNDKSQLAESTMYVTLEPCSHYGKTPPCADLIISSGIPEVVIGMQDPFGKVNGRGIDKLRRAGVKVTVGILEDKCRRLNRRFITYHTCKRPYIILKWAQSQDGYLDRLRIDASVPPAAITGLPARKLLHRWHSAEQAIMAGTNTAVMDNPRLDARLANGGRNPVRVVPDRTGRIPSCNHLKDGSIPTIIFTGRDAQRDGQAEYVDTDFTGDVLSFILDELYSRGIQSLIVEGGTKLLASFISTGLWDEARIFTGTDTFGSGIAAPILSGIRVRSGRAGNDRYEVIENEQASWKTK